jgi:acetyl esterase/lipase
MSFALDPELLQAVLAAGISMDHLPPMPSVRADWRGLRALSDAAVTSLEASLPEQESVTRTDFTVSSRDGAHVLVRWYTAPGHNPADAGPAVVYLHGGGMIAGSVQLYDRLVAAYVADSGIPMLSVDYRRAPEHPHPTPGEDCFAALGWLASNSQGLGIEPARIAVMGDSAGGGLAAATALLARERSLPLAKQILIYPMLDDRTTSPDAALVPFAGWTYDNNYTGWHAFLGNVIGTDDVPPIAAPARATDLSGLPGAYIEVGELDILRDESVEYARRLTADGTSAELHVHPGCPHGFDRAGPTVDVVKRSRADRLRVLRSL